MNKYLYILPFLLLNFGMMAIKQPKKKIQLKRHKSDGDVYTWYRAKYDIHGQGKFIINFPENMNRVLLSHRGHYNASIDRDSGKITKCWKARKTDHFNGDYVRESKCEYLLQYYNQMMQDYNDKKAAGLKPIDA